MRCRARGVGGGEAGSGKGFGAPQERTRHPVAAMTRQGFLSLQVLQGGSHSMASPSSPLPHPHLLGHQHLDHEQLPHAPDRQGAVHGGRQSTPVPQRAVTDSQRCGEGERERENQREGGSDGQLVRDDIAFTTGPGESANLPASPTVLPHCPPSVPCLVHLLIRIGPPHLATR